MERWMERYSRASLWEGSERSAARDEDARMGMMIETEDCSGNCQMTRNTLMEMMLTALLANIVLLFV